MPSHESAAVVVVERGLCRPSEDDGARSLIEILFLAAVSRPTQKLHQRFCSVRHGRQVGQRILEISYGAATAIYLGGHHLLMKGLPILACSIFLPENRLLGRTASEVDRRKYNV